MRAALWAGGRRSVMSNGKPPAERGWAPAGHGHPPVEAAWPQAKHGQPHAEHGQPQAEHGHPQTRRGSPRTERGRPQPFYGWQYTVDGGDTFLPSATTATGKTLLTGLTPLTVVGVRVNVTIDEVTSEWSDVATIVVH